MNGSSSRTWIPILGWGLAAGACFHLAQTSGPGWLTIPFCFALLQLGRAPTWRRAVYPALALGLACYGPQLAFFWGIFSVAALALWLILAAWLALFVAIQRMARERFGEGAALAIAPVLWIGLEYFRGDLYPLRFTWLSLGMAHAATPAVAAGLGVYFLGFLAMAAASLSAGLRRAGRWAPPAALAALVLAGFLLSPRPHVTHEPGVKVAGVQLEFPSEGQVLKALDALVARHPDAGLLMLSEYTFKGPVPDSVRTWCREHRRYLVAGGKDPTGDGDFHNTAFVVGPDGEIVHRQVKSVPIQFFRDGRPARYREIWHSPWGPMGIVICYDLSYPRVVDDFVRQGARAILAPTMDVADWGAYQHGLHARIAPLRAAEYGIPIFRVCSSGISQVVTARGAVTASAPFPGQGDQVAGELPMTASPRIPWDRPLAKVSVAATALVVGILLLGGWKSPGPPPESP